MEGCDGGITDCELQGWGLSLHLFNSSLMFSTMSTEQVFSKYQWWHTLLIAFREQFLCLLRKPWLWLGTQSARSQVMTHGLLKPSTGSFFPLPWYWKHFAVCLVARGGHVVPFWLRRHKVLLRFSSLVTGERHIKKSPADIVSPHFSPGVWTWSWCLKL